MELLTQELLVLGCHILKLTADDVHLFRHHRWTQGTQADRLKVWSNANTVLQGDQFVPMAPGLLFATTEQRVDGSRIETGSAVALRIHPDGHIGDAEILVVFVQRVNVHNLHQDIERAAQFVGFSQRVLYGDADDDIGSQLSGEVGRVVIAQAAIAEHLVADTDRREDGRDGHRGAHGPRQDARGEIDLPVADDIRRHTGKGYGQTAEVH